jgi:hypothetical protein
MHIGGIRSLFPPKYTLATGPDEGIEWTLTRGQTYLWACLTHLLKHVPPLDAVVALGDTMQGHRDPWATKLCASSFTDQKLAATKVMKMLKQKAKKLWMTAGTQYHNADFAENEREVAEAVGGEYVPWLNLKVNGVNIHFAHGHIGGFVYRSTPLEREIFFNLLAAEAEQAPKADIVVRAHVHFHAGYTAVNKKSFTTPCWQLPDEQSATRLASFFKQQPAIGAVLIEVGDQRDEWGNQPINIKPLTYPPVKTDFVQRMLQE